MNDPLASPLLIRKVEKNAGVRLPSPAKGRTSRRPRRSAQRAYAAGQSSRRYKPSLRRSRAIVRALKRA